MIGRPGGAGMNVNGGDEAGEDNQDYTTDRDGDVSPLCGTRLMVPLHVGVQPNTMLIQRAFVVHRLPKGSAFSGTGRYGAKGPSSGRINCRLQHFGFSL